MTRTFICIELPDELKRQLGELQADLKNIGRCVRWARTEGIHLTLKFLGDVENDKIQNIADQIEIASQGFSPIKITVQKTGAFPNFHKPRVFWVGIEEPTGTLGRLHKTIDENLAGIGFEKDQRSFSPHLTIGRVKSNDGLNAVSRALEEMNFEPVTFTATQVVVMQSQLQPKGAVYTPLRTIILKSETK